jgi:2',3'-cyclic-nucleotide 2'-phosphodiesterase
MLKVLFIGDINGKIGRETVKRILPKLKKELKADFVIANGENMAHGSGFTMDTVKELRNIGVDCFTGGDHSFDREKQMDEIFNGKLPVLRPANISVNIPGTGQMEFKVKKNKILVINLIGRVFMRMDYDCPFRKLDEILAHNNLSKNNYSAIIIDIHGEATSEKIAMKYYADGRASAILGTHTHVQTADEEITKKGTAYITDAGMCGAADECIGVAKEGILKTFLTQVKGAHVMPDKGRAIFNAVLVKINTKTGKATSIKPIKKFIEIK